MAIHSNEIQRALIAELRRSGITVFDVEVRRKFNRLTFTHRGAQRAMNFTRSRKKGWIPGDSPVAHLKRILSS